MNRPRFKAGAFVVLVALLTANLVALLMKGGDAIQIVPAAQANGPLIVGNVIYTCSEDGRTLYIWDRGGSANEPPMIPRSYSVD